MKVIKVLRCSDSMMWYYHHVGETFPLLREYETEFLTREPSGYTNIIKKMDGILIDLYSREGVV